LAQRLDWDAPVPLLATAIAHPSSRRGPSGKRPRPADPDWVDAAAGAYAMVAQEAYALAGELERAGEKLLAAQPKLRAKSAGRVIQLLLSDDAVSPARAAKAARLSDRAAAACSIGSSSLAPCANSPAARIFGSMGCSVFEQSRNRFARRKRVKKGI
jgi:lysophospholipase L1-like esterase